MIYIQSLEVLLEEAAVLCQLSPDHREPPAVQTLNHSVLRLPRVLEMLVVMSYLGKSSKQKHNRIMVYLRGRGKFTHNFQYLLHIKLIRQGIKNSTLSFYFDGSP